ncbi:MAG: hypothetical protein WBG34_04725 [Flavobacteriales bacterium]
MKSVLTPLVSLIAAITFGAGTPHGLLVDGKFRIKGLSREGARVIVERNGKQVQVLQGDISRIILDLDLQQDYVLHFIREGCLSKSLHFDTHVPEHAAALGAFRFPFIVTLEPRPNGPVLGYAKAVGTVIFNPAKGDFAYSTNYAMERERAKRRRSADVQSAAPEAVPDGQGSTERTARPVVRKEASTPRSSPEAGLRSEALSRSKAKPGGTAAPSPSGTVPTAPEGPRQDGRIEEVEVRPTYVARIVRITEQGHTREYRKVTHRYGEVYWFCNGTSCSETRYQKLLPK